MRVHLVYTHIRTLMHIRTHTYIHTQQSKGGAHHSNKKANNSDILEAEAWLGATAAMAQFEGTW